jgi:polar amino acid transport system substrate-binding protein
MSKKTLRLAPLLAAMIAIAWFGAGPSLLVAGQAQPPVLAGGPAAVPKADVPLGPATATQDDLLLQVLAAGKIVVATDSNYPPWSFINAYGDLDGFDVDVAKQVAARLGVQLEFVLPDWDDVTAGNWGGLWDVSIGSMTPTDQRATRLWFTRPYYYVKGVFAVHEDNASFADVGDLAGKKVGVGAGSYYEAYMLGVLYLGDYGGYVSYPPPPGVNLVGYASDAEAIQDLALGDGVRLDAVMSSEPAIRSDIDAGLPLKLLGTPAFGAPSVFALDQARGPSDLMLAELNEIIAAMRGDGTLPNISLRWLGFDLTTRPVRLVFLPLVVR